MFNVTYFFEFQEWARSLWEHLVGHQCWLHSVQFGGSFFTLEFGINIIISSSDNDNSASLFGKYRCFRAYMYLPMDSKQKKIDFKHAISRRIFYSMIRNVRLWCISSDQTDTRCQQNANQCIPIRILIILIHTYKGTHTYGHTAKHVGGLAILKYARAKWKNLW